MNDQTQNNIARELRESEILEAGLSRLLGTIVPPMGATDRLMSRLSEASFHESQLTLDDAGPYSFEEAAKAAELFAGSDLLAAGLEEEEINEDELDPD